MVRWSGELQVRVRFQKYSELDIGGRVTFGSSFMDYE